MQRYSKLNFRKEHIGQMNIKGGLTHENRTQKVILTLLKPYDNKTPKVALSFGISNTQTEEYTQTPSSLRFDSYGDIHTLMILLLKAKIMLGRKEGTLTAETNEYHLDREIKALKKAYRGTDKEKALWRT